MAQSDILEWFYMRFEECDYEYYTIRQVADALHIDYKRASVQIKKLWVFDSLVAKCKKQYIKGIMQYNSGMQYRLNPETINRYRIMFAPKLARAYIFQASETKNTNIPSTCKPERKKRTNGRVLNE